MENKFNLNVNVPTQGTTINYTASVEESKVNYEEPLKIVPIAGYNGNYWVSNYGQVFSKSEQEYKELKPILDNNGYYVVNLYKDGKKKMYLVHRLVNLHFNVNPLRYNVTDHINNNRLDNRASNLRWVTYKENSNNPNSNLVRPVARYTLDGEYLDERPSISKYCEDFSDTYKFKPSGITQCCQGKLKSAYGFKWQYLDKDGYLENF